MTLSETQTAILNQADQQPDGVATPPPHLPPGVRQSIARALLKGGLVAPVEATTADTDASWKLDGEITYLGITTAGREAIREGDSAEDTPTGDLPNAAVERPYAVADLTVAAPAAVTPLEAPCARDSRPRAPMLRIAAIAVLTCWESTEERQSLTDAVCALRFALELGSPATPRKPRPGTKLATFLTLLRRQEGATVAAVMAETGWAQHTVCGFFASRKKKGHFVEVLERVRQVGPGNAGARGSYSIYRIAGAA